MTTFTNIRQQVLQEINKLPDQQLNQVLQFLNNIKITSTIRNNENILNDPLADFIGGVENGTLAQGCDQELYE
jgi:hypothetical protein